jgi:hypothetical protein
MMPNQKILSGSTAQAILNRFKSAQHSFFGDKAEGSKFQEIRKIFLDKIMVPEEGVEPTRPCGHRILSPARLPVPPHQRRGK